VLLIGVAIFNIDAMERRSESMPRKPKIDGRVLYDLLCLGKSVSEIAKELHVSRQAFSKASREVRKSISNHLAVSETPQFAERRISIMTQLKKINDYANELLGSCLSSLRGDDTAIRKVRIGRREDAQDLKRYKFKDPRQIALTLMQEIREQLKLQEEMDKTFCDRKAIDTRVNELRKLTKN
jgi:predicted DNA-binding protein YlxM (UPF0122 family)